MVWRCEEYMNEYAHSPWFGKDLTRAIREGLKSGGWLRLPPVVVVDAGALSGLGKDELDLLRRYKCLGIIRTAPVRLVELVEAEAPPGEPVELKAELWGAVVIATWEGTVTGLRVAVAAGGVATRVAAHLGLWASSVREAAVMLEAPVFLRPPRLEPLVWEPGAARRVAVTLRGPGARARVVIEVPALLREAAEMAARGDPPERILRALAAARPQPPRIQRQYIPDIIELEE